MSSLRDMRKRAHLWERIRSQLEIVEPPDNDFGFVFAFCPSCHEHIGHWPEGHKVVPDTLFTGDYTCPCGWSPVTGHVHPSEV